MKRCCNSEGGAVSGVCTEMIIANPSVLAKPSMVDNPSKHLNRLIVYFLLFTIHFSHLTGVTLKSLMRLAKNESRQFGAMFEAQVELSQTRSAVGKNLIIYVFYSSQLF